MHCDKVHLFCPVLSVRTVAHSWHPEIDILTSPNQQKKLVFCRPDRLASHFCPVDARVQRLVHETHDAHILAADEV